MALVEYVIISSKGQVTIPARLRRELRIVKGERLLVVREGDTIKLVPIPRLSRLAGVDAGLFRGRKPSKEVQAMRKEWTEEFERRIQA